MSTTTTNKTRQTTEFHWTGAGTQVSFDSINEPGTYFCNWTGQLFRIPDEAIKPGHSPIISIVGPAQTFLVTKLSDNPYLPLSKARMIAADLDLNVNF